MFSKEKVLLVLVEIKQEKRSTCGRTDGGGPNAGNASADRRRTRAKIIRRSLNVGAKRAVRLARKIGFRKGGQGAGLHESQRKAGTT